MSVMDEPPTVPLRYHIAGCSEHSGKYVAENVLEDSPLDQTSRWSGAYQSPNVKQWMLLRLQDVTVLKSITFGKFHKPHPCNMKEFKVYVGMSEDSMTEVLHAGLRNDSTKETFSIRHCNNAGVCFPTRYVKVLPLSAHGQSFHTSIWHIAMAGIIDSAFVERVKAQHDEYREASVLRYVLKHLRQRRFLTPFADILSRSGVQFEHPIVSSMYESIVLKGDWATAEQSIRQASSAGLFDAYRLSCQPQARWTRLHGTDADGDIPRRRGGHAMCMDEQNGLIYLLGGWDGQQNLDDLWVYDVRKDTWRMLSMATSREKNGPGPRACHKMVFDSKTGAIYVLGRLGEDALEHTDARADISSTTAAPAPSTSPRPSGGTAPPAETTRQGNVTPLPWTAYCSEFYRYHTRGLDEGKWDLLSFDTSTSGGPPLIFDHQMVMDCEAQVIYISGGRVVDGDWELCKYSGLYAYDIRTGSWQMLQTSDANGPNTAITARFGHSMVLEPGTRTLLIFGGQRDDRYLSDMFAYHIPSGTVTELFPNFTTSGGPDACFTQRAVIDPELREIYLFCGLTRSPHGSLTVLDNESPYWIYRYERPDRPGRWATIKPTDSSPAPETDSEAAGPQPRYAHQVVYDASSKVVYMHGGNSGIIRDDGSGGLHTDAETGRGRAILDALDVSKENRLDDFWKMTLERPPVEDVTRRAIYEIRQQQFRELCEDAPAVKALAFLQAEVSSVVNHGSTEEAEAFRSLLSHLLSLPPGGTPPTARTAEASATPASSSTSTPLPRQDEEMTDSTRTEESQSAKQVAVMYDEDSQEATDGSRPSPARFKQRTEVFERLLVFVNADAKQPDKSLLELINTDGVE
ncbi:Muskelin N-terminus-domain-containing protein [Fomitopsis serialis]|uniref:Muskelin N-terminus-domain-containing protein n=1 Tax=Fomitopsis serialis TaxID=139415 RepID=UPI002007EA95|nr:Muskelin N-terminus-domain-containing protein [Neoantrodia serialis]KAH9920145.1 Muskelin N-terminus-domain-containing protein [Neoantrodia serialis]